MTAHRCHHTTDAADSQGAATDRTETGTATADAITTDPRRDTRSRWGRSERLGGGTGRLMAVSALGGLFGALLVGTASSPLAQNAGLLDGLRWTTAGVMAFIGPVFGFNPSPALAGAALILLMMTSTAVRYLIQKRRG